MTSMSESQTWNNNPQPIEHTANWWEEYWKEFPPEEQPDFEIQEVAPVFGIRNLTVKAGGVGEIYILPTVMLPSRTMYVSMDIYKALIKFAKEKEIKDV